MTNTPSISTCFVDLEAVAGLRSLLEESIAFVSVHEPDRRGRWAGENAAGRAIDVDHEDGIVSAGWVGISPCCFWCADTFHVGAERSAISVMRYWLHVLKTARIAPVEEQEDAWAIQHDAALFALALYIDCGAPDAVLHASNAPMPAEIGGEERAARFRVSINGDPTRFVDVPKPLATYLERLSPSYHNVYGAWHVASWSAFLGWGCEQIIRAADLDSVTAMRLLRDVNPELAEVVTASIRTSVEAAQNQGG